MKDISIKYEVRIEYRDGTQKFRYFPDAPSATNCHNYWNCRSGLNVRKVTTLRFPNKVPK